MPRLPGMWRTRAPRPLLPMRRLLPRSRRIRRTRALQPLRFMLLRRGRHHRPRQPPLQHRRHRQAPRVLPRPHRRLLESASSPTGQAQVNGADGLTINLTGKNLVGGSGDQPEVGGDVVIGTPGNLEITSATVSIGAGFVSGDLLSIINSVSTISQRQGHGKRDRQCKRSRDNIHRHRRDPAFIRICS